MQGDNIISALIGLVGAISNNGKTEQTDQVIKGAFLNLRDDDREEEIVRRIHEEKFRIAPDCATCLNPCGNTSDYDMVQFYGADAQIIKAKIELMEAIRNGLSSSETVPEIVYQGIAYLGYDLEPVSYERMAQELASKPCNLRVKE